ncbi:MFS transporter [Duganella violaceipulchra]|uniref:MFS family arabinose efflux permease n=1 Tax=Duganella violaceipulchra TaxID=2849652 RepID=A0AA41L1B8_9BURK|nr:MFS transporter [Duganella violaceicalia]MBV6324536.1 MFS transporter [Duganella violaceicalia]MCP2009242.1 putative MFS family arabinose efflux permease [Duganella violaceicalia]
MPLLVYILGLTIFSLTTSEFMVAGMMPSLALALGEPVTRIGYLISLYAIGMVVGGPLITVGMLKLRITKKEGLLGLLSLYVIAQSIAASATSYDVMAIARLATGVAASACFGVSLAICADVVDVRARGRAAAIVIGGLMLASVVGVPMATLIDQHLGWRASFWLVVVLTVLCMVLVTLLVPRSKPSQAVSLDSELKEFRNPHLWTAFASSGLIIGAIFAAFSYFAPILIEVSGFPPSSIPWLLGVYGVANVVGNGVVGRFADQYTIPLMVGGMLILGVSLALFAVFAQDQTISVALLVVTGLVGMSMNPAIIARVMRTAHPGPLVNTIHTSVINIGLGAGSWIGGLGIAAGYGLRSPLWVGVALAVLALISLLPYLGQRTTARARLPSASPLR